MTLLIGPPRRGHASHEPDLSDEDTDFGAADVTVRETAHNDRDPADRLRADAAAVRLHVSWPGLRRTLSAEQKEDAASPFDAESGSLSASKKLLDTKHPALRAASKIRHAAVSHWKNASLPYPESGVRLLPRADLPSFEVRMTTLRSELAEAAADVDRHRDELVNRARRRLGDLFDPADYPPSLSPLFGLSWDLPAVEPPDYLRRLSPRLYERECGRVRQRFERAVELAEQAFAQELAQLVEHLRERLTGGEGGGPRVFRDSAVENLADFFERFRRLSVGGNEELDAVVAEAEGLMHGVEAGGPEGEHRRRLAAGPGPRGAGRRGRGPGPAADRRPPPPRAADAAMNPHIVPRFRETQELYVCPRGRAYGLYGELLDAGALGDARTVRASHVEPADGGGWTADLSPSGGPLLGPFPLRSAALAAEAEWLTRNLLTPPG